VGAETTTLTLTPPSLPACGPIARLFTTNSETGITREERTLTNSETGKEPKGGLPASHILLKVQKGQQPTVRE